MAYPKLFRSRSARSIIVLVSVFTLLGAPAAWTSDPAPTRKLDRIQNEIRQILKDRESDREEIRSLRQKVEQLEKENGQLKTNSAKIETDTSQTAAQLKTLTDAVDGEPSRTAFATGFNDYLGSHRLTIAGAAAGSFIYDRQSATNTFTLQFEPLLLYRATDWLLFEGTIQASLPQGSAADYELPVADAQIFLSDYLEVLAGIYDQPFGNFYEAQSPLWVNRFVTSPLPYGAEPLVPPTDIGVQLRGGVHWGSLGQDFD